LQLGVRQGNTRSSSTHLITKQAVSQNTHTHAHTHTHTHAHTHAHAHTHTHTYTRTHTSHTHTFVSCRDHMACSRGDAIRRENSFPARTRPPQVVAGAMAIQVVAGAEAQARPSRGAEGRSGRLGSCWRETRACWHRHPGSCW
jgi:G3E family GTPase